MRGITLTLLFLISFELQANICGSSQVLQNSDLRVRDNIELATEIAQIRAI